MQIKKFNIDTIPAVFYGEKAEDLFVFVHGKCGFKEEAEPFARIACEKGYSILSVDLPSHGENFHGTFTPMCAVPLLERVMDFAKQNAQSVSLRANSIGAWFCAVAYKNEEIKQSLFVSPLLDMEALIQGMCAAEGVGEAELRERGTIETSGETLDYNYLLYAGENKFAHLSGKTAILYPEFDNLTKRETAEAYSTFSGCDLTVAKGCEHWFHTTEQLRILDAWTREKIL